MPVAVIAAAYICAPCPPRAAGSAASTSDAPSSSLPGGVQPDHASGHRVRALEALVVRGRGTTRRR